jgi:hypothetical protein
MTTQEGKEVIDMLKGVIEFVAITETGMDALGQEIDRLRADNEKLRDALSPFADFAGQPVGRPPDDMVLTNGSRMARRQLTMRDCRIAAEVFSATAP